MQKLGLTALCFLLFLLLTSCDTVAPETGLRRQNSRLRNLELYPQITDTFAVGDSVFAGAGTLIYKNPSDTGNSRSIAEGTEGEIKGGPENGFWRAVRIPTIAANTQPHHSGARRA